MANDCWGPTPPEGNAGLGDATLPRHRHNHDVDMAGSRVIRRDNCPACGTVREPSAQFGAPGVGSKAAGIVADLAADFRRAESRSSVSGKINRVLRILSEATDLYVRKAVGYKTAEGDTANVLGAKGQFADINRKFWKLKGMLWDETINMYPDAGMGESVEEVLMDLIGHAALTIDFLRQPQGENEEGPK